MQSRAADAVALGSLGGGTTLDHPTLVLPAPGAPEPVGISAQGLGGCSCQGSCGCNGMSGLTDSMSKGALIGVGAVALFAAWMLLRKKRR